MARATPAGLASPGAGSAQMIQRRGADADRGSLTLMLAVLFVALLALAGVVIDGGAKLTAAENASRRRPGGGPGRRRHGRTGPPRYASGSFVVDQDQAIAAADEYLASAGYAGRGPAGPGTGRDQGHRARSAEPTKVLSIIGIDTITATGQATANLVSGVTGPGQ